MVPGSFKHFFKEKSKEKLLSQKEMDIELGFYRRGNDNACFDQIVNWWSGLRDLPQKAWEFGRSDPRRVIFAAKVGLALTLISLLILMNEPFKDVVTYAVWAILTVVLLFEFTIGATLSKGFNRGLGTLFAGGLSLGMAELSKMTGNWEEVMIFLSIFLIGFCATFLKMYPTVKQYEYGFRVFVLTYSIIMVSGYKTRAFMETAVSRFLMISIGVLVCLVVNICIYPIWAGEDLHNLVVKNFMGVANSLEGCVNGYLQCVEYERIPSKILTYQASNDPVYSGYRSAIESTSLEDTLEGFASWEPPHGPYKMLKYPWKNYIKVSGALRHCAFMVMALHGCMLSEIQAPPERREVFSNEMKRVGTEGAKVLRELGIKVKKMVKLSPGDILVEVHEAAEELQKKIDRRSYLLVSSESWEIGNRTDSSKRDAELHHNSMQSDSTQLGIKSFSETVLDVRSFPPLSMSSGPVPDSLEISSKKDIPWPHRTSFNSDSSVTNEDKATTYESASALSLATFTSLLIEFVARLQNLVDSFQELSEKAKFTEPMEDLLA